MKIAALIRVHHKPELFKKLVSKISGRYWNSYVHVNKDSNADEFFSLDNKSLFINDRVSVQWGSYTQIVATVNLMRAAFADRSNTHFYTLTGQCYPIKSDDYIVDTIAQSPNGGNFINILKMPIGHKPNSRISGWHFNKGNAPYLPSLPAKILEHSLPKRNLGRLLHGLQPYGGSGWWLLSRSAIGHMLEFLDNNLWFTEAFVYSRLCDEVFFQTLFMALNLVADRGCPTATLWAPHTPRPKTITDDNYAEVSKGWEFMARKFENYYPDIARLDKPLELASRRHFHRT